MAPAIKRKRGRPRKCPLPTERAVAVNTTSSSSSRTAAADKCPATADKQGAVGHRRGATRALTTAHERDASRSASESSIKTARNTPPLYCELSSSSSSSSDEEPTRVLRSDVGKRPKSVQQRKRKQRRRSISSGSLEPSSSSSSTQTNDDDSGGEVYDRSRRASTLRSRWTTNAENRAMETTMRRDADVEPDLTPTTVQSDVTRHAAASRQSPGPPARHRRTRQRRRSSYYDDPDWRRYPTKPSRRPSRDDSGRPDVAVCSETPTTTPHADRDDDPPGYDESELIVLVEVQRRLGSISDGRVLRQVVDIIEASGRYHVQYCA